MKTYPVLRVPRCCFADAMLMSALALALLVAACAPAEVLIYDNFNANTANTSDLNTDLARQSGSLAPISYSMSGGPSACCGHQLQNGAATNQLLLAGGSDGTSSLNQDFGGTNSSGGLRISFDLDPLPAIYGSPDLTQWGCINLGMSAADQLVNVNDAAIHFGVLFRANGALQAFDGAVIVSPDPEPVYTGAPGGYHHIELVITDADGNPFDGAGATRIDVFADHSPSPAFSFVKPGGYSHSYINLQGFYRSHFDNLVVARASDEPPFIVSQPHDRATFLGGGVTFSVVAIGKPPLSYQWQLNGIDVPGATNSILSFSSANVANGGAYRVIVANSFGAVFSANALLAFTNMQTSPAASDHFPNSQDLAGVTNAIQGSNCSATKEPGEPDHAGKPGGSSVWYKWTAPADGIASVSTRGSTFDTLLAIYTGASVSLLTPIASDEDRGDFFTSQVQFNATQGVVYHIAIDGIGGSCGTFVLDFEFEATPDRLPVITTQPQSQTVRFGAKVTFSVTASGRIAGYRWFHNGGAIPGATENNLIIDSAQLPDLGAYAVRIFGTNAARITDSDLAFLEIGPNPCVRTRQKVEDLAITNEPCGGGALAVSRAKAAGSSGYFGGFSVTAGTILTHYFSNATNQQTVPNICNVSAGAAAWMSLTNEALGWLTIDTVGSEIDTVLQVLIYDPAVQRFVPLPCNDDILPKLNRQSRITYPATNRTVFHIYVAGVNQERGYVRMNFKLGVTNRVESTFYQDQDLGGWTTDFSVAPVFNYTSQNGGGFVSMLPPTPKTTWHWLAPTPFRGDQSAAFGGYVQFDLRQSVPPPSRDPGPNDVILSGNNGTLLYYDIQANPGTNWTTYCIPLWPSAWKLSSPTGVRPPTEPEIFQVLSNLKSLGIRGEFSDASTANDLDNVALLAPATSRPKLMISLTGPNALLQWTNTAPGLVLEASALLSGSPSAWVPQAEPVLLNGLYTVTSPTNGQKFFRLRQAGQCLLP